MKASAKKPTSHAIRLIVLMLLASGLIRLGTVGSAIARDGQVSEAASEISPEMCPPDEDLDGLFELIRERTQQLDEQEFALSSRQKDLEAAELLIRQNLTRLESTEELLAKTIASVDGASEDDIGRLTSVYEAMKPKTASELFSQMTPEFAAGFLGRMSPKAAGDIMSGLAPETAYAISVVLAGRNAKAPTQ